MEFLADKDALARIQAATDYPLQRAADGRVVGHFFHCRLTSVFQPVFDISERQVVGHAAYVRSDAINDGALSPWGIFVLAAEDPLLVRLDRLCRTLHALNYFGAVPERQILFLAVQPRLLESVKDGHGRAFEKVLDLIGVETSRVVIEIPPEVNQDRRLLKHVIVNYRSRGYRIAVNHGGESDGWMADLGSLYPDIVRLEAGQLKKRRERRRWWMRFIGSALHCWSETSRPNRKWLLRYARVPICCKGTTSVKRRRLSRRYRVAHRNRELIRGARGKYLQAA